LYLKNNINCKGEISVCGIVGYIGSRDAAPILLNGLKKLEYRAMTLPEWQF